MQPKILCLQLFCQSLLSNKEIWGASLSENNQHLILDYDSTKLNKTSLKKILKTTASHTAEKCNLSINTTDEANKCMVCTTDSVHNTSSRCCSFPLFLGLDNLQALSGKATIGLHLAAVSASTGAADDLLQPPQQIASANNSEKSTSKESALVADETAGQKLKQIFSRINLPLVATVVNAIGGLLAYFLGLLNYPVVLVNILWVISYIGGGWYGAIDAWEAFKNKSFNIDVLMLMAALGAAFIGAPAEGAILLFLFSLSNVLQGFALSRSRKEIDSLMSLRPAVAVVRRNNDWQEIKVDEVKVGDRCLIRPGATIALDGEVVSGSSEVNQAAITGENLPVEKGIGGMVYAGSQNGHGVLEVVVNVPSDQTALSKIVKTVEQAIKNKATTQSWLDRLESYYAALVISIAALIAAIPWILNLSSTTDFFYKAVTWLVIASPCALVISVPASILSAMANAAKNGILFKGGIFLELASQINCIAIDKTGTLTTGKHHLKSIYSDTLDEKRFIAICAALELGSEHILGKTVVDYAKDNNIFEKLIVSEFKALVGQGITGVIDGQRYIIGNKRLLESYHLSVNEQCQQHIKTMQEDAQTIVYVASVDNKQLLGLLGFADSLRAEAKDLTTQLTKAGINKIVMLTGDNQVSARKVAQDVGIADYYYELMPSAKVDWIKKLAKDYKVAMVGDGINDAQSLVSAHLGISMGKGATDLAVDTADVVLISNNLSKLAYLLKLAKKSQSIIKQNLIFSAAVIFLLVIINFWGHLPLPIGVVAHEGSTVLVIFNGLRLLLQR